MQSKPVLAGSLAVGLTLLGFYQYMSMSPSQTTALGRAPARRGEQSVLLTGAAGFVGFHTAIALKERGDKVVGLDNFNNYYSTQLKRDRAAQLKKKDVTIVEGDVCDQAVLQKTIKEHKITSVIHLAAQAGVRYSIKHPQEYIRNNVECFVNLLETLKTTPEIPLIYASSSSVYGGNEKVPFSEKDPVDNQVSLYAATKRSDELLANVYHVQYKLRLTALRFFTVYGPLGRPDMAYWSFAEKMMQGKPIPVFNEGKMMRDFTYIDDIVAGILGSLDLAAPWEIFNLGNNQPVELMAFIRALESALNVKANLDYKPMQQGDVVKTFADISHAQAQIGYTPRISVQDGLSKFGEWFREYCFEDKAKAEKGDILPKCSTSTVAT